MYFNFKLFFRRQIEFLCLHNFPNRADAHGVSTSFAKHDLTGWEISRAFAEYLFRCACYWNIATTGLLH